MWCKFFFFVSHSHLYSFKINKKSQQFQWLYCCTRKRIHSTEPKQKNNISLAMFGIYDSKLQAVGNAFAAIMQSESSDHDKLNWPENSIFWNELIGSKCKLKTDRTSQITWIHEFQIRIFKCQELSHWFNVKCTMD